MLREKNDRPTNGLPTSPGAEGMQEALAQFLRDEPAYRGTEPLDELRAREYGRLDAHGHAYLDYTGGSLYADCQLHAHTSLLCDGVFGNPHSSNPTSQAMTCLVEHARERVLDYFCASQDEYVVVFTPNAT